jgi:hypothetical protein
MKFLKIVLILMMSFVTTSFTPIDYISPKYRLVQTYQTQPYKGWTQSGSGYWIQGTTYNTYNDFDYMITRSVNKINGYYYYDFWFYSQSYYWDGYNAQYTSTNIKNFVIYNMNNSIVTSDMSSIGITFKDTYNAKTLTFISTSPDIGVRFKWGGMRAK